ncbi:hypothetical protein N7507_004903 [Penicillium longicatenatum]|nr:hypothetical protein N7507_004903 [Penicillium longicatenatum]
MDVSAFISKKNEAQNKEVTLDDAALGFSIDTVSSTVLQSLLRSICETIPEAKKKAIEHLLIEKSQIPTPPGSKRDHDAYKGTTDASGQKLGCRRPKYSQCETCKKEFNTLTNNSSACRYHTEDAYADEDSHLFVDNDFFGPEEADSNDNLKKDHPDCFIFECCGDSLKDNPHGCETDWHKEAASHVRAMTEHMARVAPETHVAKKARIL